MCKLLKKSYMLSNTYCTINYIVYFLSEYLEIWKIYSCTILYIYFISYSTHSGANLNRRFRGKTFKVVISSLQTSDFQSQFSMSKIIWILLKKIHGRISFQGHIFCYWHFLKTSISKPLYFLKWCPIFDDFYSILRGHGLLIKSTCYCLGILWIWMTNFCSRARTHDPLDIRLSK